MWIFSNYQGNGTLRWSHHSKMNLFPTIERLEYNNYKVYNGVNKTK